MLFRKLSIITVAIVLSCGRTSIAEANIACQNKFSIAAFGDLEKSDLDSLKKRYVAARRSMRKKERDSLSNYEVQGILGFSGQQTKTAGNGRIEHRIWIDRDSCKRKVKASFMDGELVKFKSYGF